MRTANPALSDKTFEGIPHVSDRHDVMNIQGTVNKTFFLLGLLVLSAVWVWEKPIGDAGVWIIGGAIGGLIVAIVTIFKKAWSPVTAPSYALLEGLVIGGISSYFESMYEGIVIQAVVLTFGTLFALLIAYTSRLIKVTENFKLGVVAAT